MPKLEQSFQDSGDDLQRWLKSVVMHTPVFSSFTSTQCNWGTIMEFKIWDFLWSNYSTIQLQQYQSKFHFVYLYCMVRDKCRLFVLYQLYVVLFSIVWLMSHCMWTTKFLYCSQDLSTCCCEIVVLLCVEVTVSHLTSDFMWNVW